jgi:argininosuccinate synthase
LDASTVILAYSGGLDTSVILRWLIDKGHDVVAYVADVGQNDDFGLIKEKALACGASKVNVADLKTPIITDYVFPALAANAKYEGQYLLGTAVARPIIAKTHVDIALAEGATHLCHGATGKGNDQARFELAYMTLMPQATILSPWKDREWLSQFKGRKDMIAYAKQCDIPIPVSLEKPFSMDENLLHTSYEAGVLEDPSRPYDPSMLKKGSHFLSAPDEPDYVTITFSGGVPVRVENTKTGEAHESPYEMFSYLNTLGETHGIGIVDMVENRLMGMKSRGVYVTPGGTILYNAHRDIESITLDKQVQYYKEWMAIEIGRLIYNGLWFSPEFDFLMQSVRHSQQYVNGTVDLLLYKGNATVLSRASDASLYDAAVASMDEDGGYDQTDAKGFIRLYGLRLKAGYRP